MWIFRNVLLGAVAVMGMALPAIAAERAIIVLDGSGSMWAQIDGKARITIARETLASVLENLPDDLELGFMTYGHRKKGDCADIEMLVEPATGTGPAIIAAADAISPKGMTPISDAVRLAAEDLRFTEEKATVILITDGLETCEVDPCALASELEAEGVDFTTHVLGFGLSDEEGQQVACLAENTGGKYLAAGDGAALVEALTTTVAQVTQSTVKQPEPKPEPAPEPVAEYNLKPTIALSEGGPDIIDESHYIVWKWYKPATDGGEGEYVGTDYFSRFQGSLEAGEYVLTAEVDYIKVSQPITIEAGKVSTPHFVLNGAILKLHPRPSEGADVDSNAVVEIRHDGEGLGTDYGEVDVVVPAGKLDVDVSIGEGKVTRSYSPKAGDTVDEDIVVGVGTAKVLSSYVADMEIDDDIYVEIVGAKKSIDGTRESVAYNYGGDISFELPEGDYVAVYDLDGTSGEVPFSVKTAEIVEVPLILDAGVLQITTPTDDYIEIFGTKKDILGKRTSFDYGYGPTFQTTLKAGDYVVYSKKGETETETPVSITGGERFELTVQADKAGKTK